MARRRILVSVLGLMAMSAWLLVALVLWMSKALRPIADDYLNGALAAEGLLAGIVGYWETWSGSLFSYGLQVALVGIPLANLPWGLSSAVPFFATTAAVTGSLLVMAGSLTRRWTKPSLYLFIALIVPLIAGLWWAFWWAPVAIDSEPSEVTRTLAQIVTYWQTVNVQYLVSAALLASLLVVCVRLPKERVWLRTLGLLTFGILTGLSGPVLALSVVISAILLLLGLALANRANRQVLREVVMTVLVTTSLALIAHFSPGNTNRVAFVDSGALRENPDPFSVLRALGRPFSDLLQAYFSAGGVLMLVAAASTAVLLRRFGWSFDAKLAFQYAAILAGFSFVFAVVIRVGDLFAYDGLWHILPVRLIAWWTLMLLGLAIGTVLLDRFTEQQLMPASLFLLGASLILIGTSVVFMTTSMNERLVTWNSGPAPIYLVSDIESGMWDREWALLKEVHAGPERPIP